MQVQLDTSLFLDRPVVQAALARAGKQTLGHVGGYIRRVARNAMESGRGGRSSAPGEAPRYHTRRLKDLIFYAVELNAGGEVASLVVGPVPFPSRAGAATIPRRLEEGGQLPARRNHRRRVRTVGGTGEIRVYGRPAKTTKIVHRASNRESAHLGMGDAWPVTYARLTSENQVGRANRINEELYGPLELPVTTIAPRPFMSPAFAEAQSQTKLREFFQDTIR